ncbi:putative aminoacyltransferase, E1 ubiquitin-activating enzyme [Lupinus albus]|uniref:U-box domain-containing protein n=1 Tax=Lupinus albus TaxID=3870 RepID=A0A6A4NDV7_LUPAL|nr:putative aminoacyltransferase, E1 ubiquitin-activating enzyme [Lupinus albus]
MDLEVPCYFEKAMEKMHGLAIESERNRQCMVEAGVVNAMVHVITKSFKQGRTRCLEEALTILCLLWNSAAMVNNMKHLVGENLDFINSLTWILQLHQVDNNVKMVNEVIPILKSTIEVANSTILGNLKLEFFIEIISIIKNNRALSLHAIKSALHVLIETCSLGRNRVKIVEAGAVMELIELALEKQEKNITELMFILLAHLCSCADGREQFLHHAASIAMLSKKTLRVSSTTDDQALRIFSLISKFSASNEVVKEMLRVGAVTKLCMVMQADCASYCQAHQCE